MEILEVDLQFKPEVKMRSSKLTAEPPPPPMQAVKLEMADIGGVGSD